MQVSFIIPLYNNLALTRACVDTLRATLPAALTYEIILVDDGSTDGTRAWLATLGPPFRVVLNDRNLGYARANNRAATFAQGDFLVLLNNDLILTLGWFDPLLSAHQSLAERAGLIGNIQLNARTGEIDHTGIVINAQGKPVHDRTLPSRLSRLLSPVRTVPALTGACLLLGRDLWQQLGGFDEGYVNGGEDVDLCFRARALGRTNVCVLTSVVRHHISASVGRKLRDEENSHRLARRWHREFILAADGPLRDWCRAQWENIFLDPRGADLKFAWAVWRHAHGFTRIPPAAAYAALEAALAREFAHWEKTLPPPSAP